MAPKLQYSSPRDAQLAALLESGIDVLFARTCDLLLQEEVVAAFVPNAVTVDMRATALAWLVSQLSGWDEPTFWLSSSDQLSTAILSRARHDDLARHLAPPHRDPLGDRQLQRQRKEIVKRVGDALFARPLVDQTLLALLRGRWIVSQRSEGLTPAFAQGVHPPHQFEVLAISWEYSLDRALLPTLFVDKRRLLPRAHNIEYWSITVKCTSGNDVLIPTVAGARFFGMTRSEPPDDYRRYFLKFDEVLNEGDPAIEITVTFKYNHGQPPVKPEPVLGIAQAASSEGVADHAIKVNFAADPRLDVYAFRGPSTAFPYLVQTDDYSYRRRAKQVDQWSFTAESKGLRPGYTLALHWPLPIDL